MKLFAKFVKPSSAYPSSGMGFGCMGITTFYGGAMEQEAAMKLLQTVYDNGCRHFDTAELYSNEDPEKHNEKVLGKFLKTVPRDSYTVGTKYFPSDGKYDYDTVKEHLKKSLERLQLEYVDLYYCHRVTNLEGGLEFAKAAKKLKEEGLIREVGLSEVNGKWLQQIHKEACPIDAVQQEWSILTRNLESELIPVCKELGITVVAYSPLSRNLLVQKFETPPKDARGQLPRYKNMEQNKKFAEQVQKIAEKNNCTPAQVCLAWLFQKADEMGVDVIPIPGTTKTERAISNIQAVDVKIVDPEDMKLLDGMAKDVVGDRYPSMGNGMTIETQL
jgi:aryl-alcohol dehydrogenase-like predicted oxidoreductase